MAGLVLRRLALIPVALLLVHFFGYAYAYIANAARIARGASGPVADTGTLWTTYGDYLLGALRLDFGVMPYAAGRDTIAAHVARVGVASIGLLLLAFVLSVLLGLVLGLRAVQVDPPRIALWLTSLTTAGLAMPSFFVGSLLIAAAVAYLIYGPAGRFPLPLGGFGWDAHLVLPVLVLLVRPTAQIAQVTSGLLAEELGKQYVVAARSLGHSWRRIFRRYALRNIMPAVAITIAGTLRLLVGELLIVEWLFEWPGLGRLVAQTLVPSSFSSTPGAVEAGSLTFLYPPLLAAALTIFAALFLLVDFVAMTFAAAVDPRLRGV